MNNNIETIVEVKKVIYPRSYKDGDWSILSAYDTKARKYITIKGEVFDLRLNTPFKLLGEYENNDKYGEQYNILMLIPHNDIENKENLRQFLLYILSPSIVDNLFNTLENPVQAIKEGNIEELCTVKGVKEITAKRIIERYEENEMYAEAYVELGKYGLTLNMIKRIVARYKNVNVALNKLKTNPYELVSIRNIGWKKADEIAQRMGFTKRSPERLEGFINYHLNEEAQMGNSWLSPSQLVSAIYQMYADDVKFKRDDILKLSNQVLGGMFEKKIIYWNDNKTFIALSKYYNLEAKIYKELKRLINAKSDLEGRSLKEVVKEIEEEKGYSLTKDQIDAIEMSFRNNVLIISGFSGTGKSTSVQGILKTFDNYSYSTCALSGKASANLVDITQKESSTIHRLLGYQPKVGFGFNKHNNLSDDIIVVDEISMVGGELFLSLLEAMKDGSKLIMLGDHNQLPSLGAMNLLQDMLDSPAIPKKILTEIHRQAKRSAIITESMKVKDGIQITEKTGVEIRGELKDLILDVYSGDSRHTAEKVVNYFKRMYEKIQDINKIQVVVPMRTRGDSSAFAISNTIQDIYNPVTPRTKRISLKKDGKDFEIRTGDKVINRKNNYNLENTDDESIHIFNGYMGMVKDVDEKDRRITISFDYEGVGDVIISGEQLNHIELAYAITCHSFQGSQSDVVIVGVDSQSYMLLSKEWIYTAITRPRKYCVLVAQQYALNKAISQSSIQEKQTFLKSFLDMEDVDLVSYQDEYDEEEDF